MKYLKDMDSLTEKRVTVKRRYTEKYPAKNISTAARIRNAVIEAMGDGVLTEEELSKILHELKAHKRWLSRNTKLFNISEDQSGIKTFCLSPFGKRVQTKTSQLNEGVYVPSNIEEFAKRRGALPLVKKIAKWAEKAGKNIAGGTAIGKGYDTLILDLRHHGGEIRINLRNDEVTLFDEPVKDAKSFKKVYDKLKDAYS